MKHVNGETEKTQSSISPTAILGEMIWLYSVSEVHQQWPVGCIHQWLLPAITNQQYRLYHHEGRPVGLITWAWLSEEVETTYVRNPKSLDPKQWKSGDRLWFPDFIAPFGHARKIFIDLKNNIFPNDVARTLRYRKDSDTMKIKYVHGANALEKARDWDQNPTVKL